jgi:hypothetical protein
MKPKNKSLVLSLLGFVVLTYWTLSPATERTAGTISHSVAGDTFTVINTQDSGAGSFRQAITDANSSPGTDIVNFNLPGGGFQTIVLTSPLPTITDPVTIDGTTQPGYANVPLIIVSGQGLRITAGGSTVKAIAVIRAAGGITFDTAGGNSVTGCYLGINPANEADTTTGNGFGVEITNSPNNQIGSNFNTALRNVIAYNTGVRITGAGSTGNVVVGNIFGMRSNGTDTATGNGNYGVYIESASGNRIGGTTAAERNLLSGYNRTSNSSAGIELFMATNNQVEGNFIGTDITGTIAKPNRDGIRIIEAANNMIGSATGTTFAGPCTGGCNLIAGNARDGIRLIGSGSNNNRIDYNYIGLSASGLAALRNLVSAIEINNAPNNVVGKPFKPTATAAAPPAVTGPPATLTVQNEDFCITITPATNSHVLTQKRGGGLPIQGTGAWSISNFGTFRYVSDPGQDLRVTVDDPDDPDDPLGYASVEFVGLPPNLFRGTVSVTGCLVPNLGEQHITGIVNDNVFPGLDPTEIVGNVFNGSVDGATNFGGPGEDSIFFRFSSNVVTADNTLYLRGLAANASAFESGHGNLFFDNRVSWAAQGAFNFSSDPTVLDLDNNNFRNAPGTGAANNGLRYPTFVRATLDGENLNITGNVTGPANSTLTSRIYLRPSHRNLAGVENVITVPTGIECPVNINAQGNGVLNFTANTSAFVGSEKLVISVSGSTGDTSEASVPTKVPERTNDFDNDGFPDFAVVRPGVGNTQSYWYIFHTGDATIRVQPFGLGDDKVMTGDYQGDDVNDFAVYRPSNSTFYHSRINGNPATVFDAISWGSPGDLPVAGDFDGDGANDAAVFRPSDRTWYIRQSLGGDLFAQQWGLPTDTPVAADYDGDGDTDIAVYRGGTWYISVCPQCPASIVTFGISTDVPVPGDYDGDGIDDIAIWRPTDGAWWILQSRTGSPTAIQWGLAGDRPVKGDWDADGKNDIAVWRPSSGDWWVLRSADASLLAFHWGQNGDIPVPAFPNAP